MNKLEKCYKIVDEVIRKDCKEEAKEILKISEEDILDELILYHKKKQFNIVCLVVDKAVDDLVKNKKWKIKKDDNFKGLKAAFGIDENEDIKEKMYYIQDTRQYVGNAVLWWGENSCGYTTDITKAGKYSEEEAKNICKNRTTDRAWLCSHIDENIKQYVDMQYINKKYSLTWKNKKK